MEDRETQQSVKHQRRDRLGVGGQSNTTACKASKKRQEDSETEQFVIIKDETG